MILVPRVLGASACRGNTGRPAKRPTAHSSGLRYALIPYIYSVSRVAHETGLPLLRGMYLEYPDQEPAYQSQEQYMFGKDLLVAPV